MNSTEIISKVSSKNLSQEETAHVMQEIFLGTISEQEIENFLLSLSEKGETSDELTGAVLAMRAASLKVDLKEKNNLVDCCGTGGLGKSMMNVSTTAGLVSAAAKVKIAKHGNRTATGKSGSADVLEVANWNWIYVCPKFSSWNEICHASKKANCRQNYFQFAWATNKSCRCKKTMYWSL